MASEYNVDPPNCISGGLFGAGRMRNLPNKVSMAIPTAAERLASVDAALRDTIVCAYGDDVPYILSEYRRHPWHVGSSSPTCARAPRCTALHGDDESSALASSKIVASCARQEFVGLDRRIWDETHLHGACVSRAQGGSPARLFSG